MSTTFLNMENGASSTLRADHAAGDGTLKVQTGHGTRFGSTWPARVTVVHVSSGVVAIFRLSGRTGDDLTVVGPLEGTNDIALPSGSVVKMTWSKGAAGDIYAAVAALESGHNPGGADGQVQIKVGTGFGAIAGTATGANAVALGSGCVVTAGNFATGTNCTADAEQGCVAMGASCESVDIGDGGCDWAFSMGRMNKSQSCASFVIGQNGLGDVRNKFVIGSGGYNSAGGAFLGSGESQLSILPLGEVSTSATPVVLVTNGGGGPGDTVFRPVIRPGATYAFVATILGRKTDGSKNAMFIRQGMIQNLAGTTALIGSVGTIGVDINTPGWVVAITADNTNDAIQIQVTGEATVHWTARLDCVEVK